MSKNLDPGTLAKLKDNAWPQHELSTNYDCVSSDGKKYAPIERRTLCGQLAEIIKADYDCYVAWLPCLQVIINCYKSRFEPITKE